MDVAKRYEEMNGFSTTVQAPRELSMPVNACLWAAPPFPPRHGMFARQLNSARSRGGALQIQLISQASAFLLFSFSLSAPRN